MLSGNMLMAIISAVVIIVGAFLGIKGKSSMIRERFSSGVSPENERKFMLTVGGAISVIGLDCLVLSILVMKTAISEEIILTILGIGLVLFVVILLIGQKYFRK